MGSARLLLVSGHRLRPQLLRDVDLRERREAGLGLGRTGKEQDRLARRVGEWKDTDTYH